MLPSAGFPNLPQDWAHHPPVILVVDDVIANVRVLCAALAKDYDVRFATSGQQALAIAEQCHPELILLDVMMPEMNGHDIQRHLRAHPTLHNTPVIFISADDSQASELEGLAHGAEDYITKPIVIPIVLARVRNLLVRNQLKRQLEMSLAGAEQGLWEWDMTTGAVLFNNDWAVPLGYAAGELPAKMMTWEQIIFPDDMPVLQAASDAYRQQDNRLFEPEVRMRHKSGKYVWMQLHGRAVLSDPTKHCHRLCGTYMCVERRKRAELRLQNNERKLAAILASLHDTVIVLESGTHRISHCHIPVQSPLAPLNMIAIDQQVEDIFPATMASVIASGIADCNHSQSVHRRELDVALNDRRYWLQITTSPLASSDDDQTGFLVVIQDFTDRKNAEDQIRALAFYDPLTGLPNRRLLLDRLQVCTSMNSRNNMLSALLFLDLDNFKQINDSLGHDAGDALLVEVAQRLRTGIRESDTIARLGGDEFIVLLTNLHESVTEAATLARKIGEKIIRAFTRKFELKENPYQLSTSIGICLFGGGERESHDELLKRADMALYAAKSGGRNQLCFYDASMSTQLLNKVRLEQALNFSLQENRFVLNYQPKVNRLGEFIGVEALARWQHPQEGLVFPGSFIPFAEECGLIIPIGNVLLDKACAQLASWQKNPSTAAWSVAVNISYRQFQQPDFVENVAEILRLHGADGRGLVFEITESLFISEMSDVTEKMNALKLLGIRFSLDDFGTGYSSLVYLKTLPFEEIKIDQSFVGNVSENPANASIVRAILALGRILGISVIAEGVESAEQWQFLLAEGCTEFQGYYFSQPVTADKLR